jgi:hypothetical protein
LPAIAIEISDRLLCLQQVGFADDRRRAETTIAVADEGDRVPAVANNRRGEEIYQTDLSDRELMIRPTKSSQYVKI